MKIIKKGITRTVILIGWFAIKIPNPAYSHKHFLTGCLANWTERSLTKNTLDGIWKDKINPTIFCVWFGLLSIQKRCKEIDRHLTELEIEFFADVTTDIKKDNFGFLNGKLVCFDYA